MPFDCSIDWMIALNGAIADPIAIMYNLVMSSVRENTPSWKNLLTRYRPRNEHLIEVPGAQPPSWSPLCRSCLWSVAL